MKKIAYVGTDYHLNSLSIAVMLEGKKKLRSLKGIQSLTAMLLIAEITDFRRPDFPP